MNERYSRQTMLPEIGEAGQERLRQARVLIVGVGGLGSPVALYLTAAGVGCLGLVDDDVVSVSNLQRQVLYTEAEVGAPKVECARRRLSELNSTTRIETYPTRLTAENAAELVANYDLVVDGCDNAATRYLIDEECARQGKPYVYGSIAAFEGQVSVFNYRGGPRYSDLYPRPAVMPVPQPGGVVGSIPGLIGCLQASEAIKIIAGCGEVLSGKLYWTNLLTLQHQIIEL